MDTASRDGPARHITKLFKRYYEAARDGTSDNKLYKPFFCINVSCPHGSYDPNIEPAKDDVLFLNDPAFVEIIKDFFKSVYGEVQEKCGRSSTVRPSTATQSIRHESLTPMVQPFAIAPPTSPLGDRDEAPYKEPGLLLPPSDVAIDLGWAPRPALRIEPARQHSTLAASRTPGAAVSCSSRPPNVHGAESEDEHDYPNQNDGASNPWTIAKKSSLNARRPLSPLSSSPRGADLPCNTPRRQVTSFKPINAPSSGGYLPTPKTIRVQRRRDYDDVEHELNHHRTNSLRPAAGRYTGSLDTWLSPSGSARPNRGFQPASSLPEDSAPIGESQAKPMWAKRNRDGAIVPFRPPLQQAGRSHDGIIGSTDSFGVDEEPPARPNHRPHTPIVASGKECRRRPIQRGFWPAPQSSPQSTQPSVQDTSSLPEPMHFHTTGHLHDVFNDSDATQEGVHIEYSLRNDEDLPCNGPCLCKMQARVHGDTDDVTRIVREMFLSVPDAEATVSATTCFEQVTRSDFERWTTIVKAKLPGLESNAGLASTITKWQRAVANHVQSYRLGLFAGDGHKD